MTNELTTVCVGTLFDPPSIALWTSWVIALITAIGSIIVAVYRLRRGKTVVVIATINTLVAVVSGLGCFSSLAWATYQYLFIFAGLSHPSVQILALSVSQAMFLAAISIVLCGINGVIGLSLSLKWKEPQQSVPAYPPQGVGSAEP